MKRIPSKFSLLSAPILWLILIWMLSSIPGKDLPTGKIFSWDKLAHWMIYLILCLLINRCIRGMKIGKGNARLIYFFVLISAALDEYHQSYIPGRSVTYYDFAANAMGVLSGYLIGVVKSDFRN